MNIIKIASFSLSILLSIVEIDFSSAMEGYRDPENQLNLQGRLNNIAIANTKIPPHQNILILGAGMTGIVAACELKRLGHTVLIIEASGRMGGRVWTHRFDNGEHHELGAMRIPESHDYTRHYVEEAGLSENLRPFVSSHQNKKCFYHLRGKTSRIEAASTVFDQYVLSPSESTCAASSAPSLLRDRLEEINKSLTSEDKSGLFGNSPLTDRVAELDNLLSWTISGTEP